MHHDIYSTLSVALAELERRKMSDLPKRVEKYFKSLPPPDFLEKKPFAIYAPSLVTPNLELMYLLSMLPHLSFRTEFLEYQQDKFVHINVTKRALGNLTFVKQGLHGAKLPSSSVRVVDFDAYQGKPLTDVLTKSGEKLTDFHHRLLQKHPTSTTIVPRDFSEWFRAASLFDSELSYLRYLGLFITDGILFGNFTSEKYESSFTLKKVIPAVERLISLFGVTPLIVPIEPPGTDEETSPAIRVLRH